MGKNNNGRFETQSEADVDGPAYVGVDSSEWHLQGYQHLCCLGVHH